MAETAAQTMERHASCQCGRLQPACRARPERLPGEQVPIAGISREWIGIADSGVPVERHFCCEWATLYRSRPLLHAIAIPIGAFAGPGLRSSGYSVREERRHPWMSIIGEGIRHID
jgi:hypothetical protein